MEEDDVPPLEDMSEAFSNRLKLREESSKLPATRREILEVPPDVEKSQAKRIEKLLGKDDVSTMAKDNKEKEKNAKKTDATNTYCGFKKGFFSQESTNNKPKNKKDIPIVTKKVDENKNVLPEVQKAINQQMPLLKSNEWVTEDLMKKVAAHPRLSRQLLDPRYSDLIQQFQSNPEQVKRMSESNSEIKQFIQDFCGILGDHFTELGEKQDQLKEALSGNSKQPLASLDGKKPGLYPGDRKNVEAIFSNPEIRDIINSEEVQKILSVLSKEPEKGPGILRTVDPKLRRKIQKLVDVGLLQIVV